MKYRIRRAISYRELEQVYALDLLIFGISDGSLGSMDDLNGSDWWLIWDQDDNPVGYCGVVLYDRFAFHKRCGVIRQARGHGLQRKMLRLRENYARKNGCTTIATYVSIQNTYSANNLIKAGYIIYNPEWRWAGDEFLYVIKTL